MSSTKRQRHGEGINSHVSQIEAEYNAVKEKAFEMAGENERLVALVNTLTIQNNEHKQRNGEFIEHILDCGSLSGLKPSIREMVASYPDAAALLHQAVNKFIDENGQKGHNTYTLNYCLQLFGKCLAGSEDLLSLPEGANLAYDFTIRWAIQFYEEAESRIYWLQTKDFHDFDIKTVDILERIVAELEEEQEDFTNAAGTSLLDRRNKMMTMFSRNETVDIVIPTPSQEAPPPAPEPAIHLSPAAPGQTGGTNISEDLQPFRPEIELPDIEIGLSIQVGPLELARRRIKFYRHLSEGSIGQKAGFQLKPLVEALENHVFGIFKAQSCERLRKLINSHENGFLDMGAYHEDAVRRADTLCDETAIPIPARKLYSATAAILRNIVVGNGAEGPHNFDPYSTLVKAVAKIDYVQEIEDFETKMLLGDQTVVKYLEQNHLKVRGDLLSVIISLLARNLALEKKVLIKLRVKSLALWTLSQTFGRGIAVIFAVGGNPADTLPACGWKMAETEEIAAVLMETLPEFKELCSVAEANILTTIETGHDLKPVQESKTAIGLFSGGQEDQIAAKKKVTWSDKVDEFVFDDSSSHEVEVDPMSNAKKRTSSENAGKAKKPGKSSMKAKTKHVPEDD